MPLFQLGGIFITELQGFHEQFRDCFARSEPRENFFRYLVGQLSDLERKSIEPMSLQVEDGNARAMQRLISDVIWDETAMLRKYHELVAEDSGGPNGVMIFDETSFFLKGADSIGVARQYCGSVGKVENCQVGVFAAYASPQRTKSRRRLRSRQKLLLSTSTNFSGINARLPKARKALWNTSLLRDGSPCPKIAGQIEKSG